MCSTTSSGSTTSDGGIPSSATAVPRSTRRVMLLNPCPRNWGKSSKDAPSCQPGLSARGTPRDGGFQSLQRRLFPHHIQQLVDRLRNGSASERDPDRLKYLSRRD